MTTMSSAAFASRCRLFLPGVLLGAGVLLSGCSPEDSKGPPETAMPRTGDGQIPEETGSAGKSNHPRFLGATFAENISALPLSERVPGTWESVDTADVEGSGVEHVALRFGDEGSVQMASYSLDGVSPLRQEGTYQIEDEVLQIVFPANQEPKVTFEGDDLILHDVSGGAKVRFRKRIQDLPLEDTPGEGGA